MGLRDYTLLQEISYKKERTKMKIPSYPFLKSTGERRSVT
jgi:hypothetical protein